MRLVEAGGAIVIFVGGCEMTRSAVVAKHGGIPCTTDEYTPDGAENPKLKRIVVIGPDEKTAGLYIRKTLPITTSLDDVGKEVDAARLKAGSKKLNVPNWDI